MKTVKKLVSFALIALLFLCLPIFSGCLSHRDTYKKALKINLETANKYSFAGNYGIMVDKTFFSYRDALGSSMLYTGFNPCDDKVYFTGRGSNGGFDGYGQPTKAAIWSMDYHTGESVLIKEVDTVTMPYGNGAVERFIEDRVMLRYGGMFEIFDMKRKLTLYEETDDVGYRMNNTYILGNHYGVKAPNNIFKFYKNCGDNYQLYTITLDNLWSMSNVRLLDDILYFWRAYNDQEKIYLGVNYKTNEIIPTKEAEDMISLFSLDGNASFLIGEESFEYYEYKNESNQFAPHGITIERKSDGTKRFINCEYLYAKSTAYKRITNLWKKHDAKAYNYSLQPNTIFVASNKIIIACEAYSVREGFGAGYEPPLYFLEYDFDTETVLYAGSGALGQGVISKVVKVN